VFSRSCKAPVTSQIGAILVRMASKLTKIIVTGNTFDRQYNEITGELF
jgi:hypothetical protein